MPVEVEGGGTGGGEGEGGVAAGGDGEGLGLAGDFGRGEDGKDGDLAGGRAEGVGGGEGIVAGVGGGDFGDGVGGFGGAGDFLGAEIPLVGEGGGAGGGSGEGGVAADGDGEVAGVVGDGGGSAGGAGDDGEEEAILVLRRVLGLDEDVAAGVDGGGVGVCEGGVGREVVEVVDGAVGIPDDGVADVVGDIRVADDEAGVVDGFGLAHVAAGEGAKAGHHAIFVEEGAALAIGDGGFADDLAGAVDGIGLTEEAAEGAEVGGGAVFVEEGSEAAHAEGLADDLAGVVDGVGGGELEGRIVVEGVEISDGAVEAPDDGELVGKAVGVIGADADAGGVDAIGLAEVGAGQVVEEFERPLDGGGGGGGVLEVEDR